MPRPWPFRIPAGADATPASIPSSGPSIPFTEADPMLQKEHDVLIVGSGHAGGMAAKVLTEKGISCLILEAGPEMDYQRDRTTKAVHELPYRGFNKPGRLPHVIQANKFNANQWVDEHEVPYTHPPDAWANW